MGEGKKDDTRWSMRQCRRKGVDGIWGRGSCASDLGDSFRAALSESKSPDERVSGGRAILANKIWAIRHWLHKEGQKHRIPKT